MTHIADILGRRHMPAAGLFLSLTRRCPLSCAHCSTNSTVHSEEHPADPFLRLAGTFSERSRPEFMFLTGGEALLRLPLVRELAALARQSGTQTVLITGLFFARRRAVLPDRIAEVLSTLDHVVVSHDRFHEPEVPRAHALEVVEQMLAAGIDVSLQMVGDGPGDCYLADSVAAVRERFGDRVPALAAPLGAVGRGAALFDTVPAAPPTGGPAVRATPCAMAAWPAVGYDGTVLACCSQDVLDGPAPDHLVLGHAARDDWETIARRCRESAALRALRTYGPEYLTERFQPGCGAGGYCNTCRAMGERPAVLAGTRALVGEPAFVAIEKLTTLGYDAAGAEGFARRYGIGEYADLLTLGRKS